MAQVETWHESAASSWRRSRPLADTGGNAELRALASDTSLGYCRKSFRSALLEYRASRTADDIIIGSESFWKRILLTRVSRD